MRTVFTALNFIVGTILFIFLIYFVAPKLISTMATDPTYLEWRSPRVGTTNPTPITSPIWEELIRSKESGWQANKRYFGPSSFDTAPAWSFDRFGQSKTLLPDGRTIYIAGEHEDYYDPDFYIYNDVIVIHPDERIEIFIYSRADFPPTDFHTATLVGNEIIIIGNLGYTEQRIGEETQVLALNIDDYTIRKIETTGNKPGWIHKHEAALNLNGESISISQGLLDLTQYSSLLENIDDWKLDLQTWEWTRETHREWPRFSFTRADESPHQLFELSSLAFSIKHRDQGIKGIYDSFDKALEMRFENEGRKPDLSLETELYRPTWKHEPIEQIDNCDEKLEEDEECYAEYNIHRVTVEGVTVRYVENWNQVTLTIEGKLPEATVGALKDDLLNKLQRFEDVDWKVSQIITPLHGQRTKEETSVKIDISSSKPF